MQVYYCLKLSYSVANRNYPSIVLMIQLTKIYIEVKTLLFTKVKGRLQQLFIIGRKDGLNLTCQKFPDSLTIPPVPHAPHYDKQMTYDDRILNEIDIDASMSGAGVNSEQAQAVQVRYVAYPNAIHVYVLGKLSDDILDCLTQNLCHQLAKLEKFGCGVWEVPI